MLTTSPQPGNRVLFQSTASDVQMLRRYRDRIHALCRDHLFATVQVQTMDGHVHTGQIVGCDGAHLYIRTTGAHGGQRGFYTPADQILTLVLYELLVITLLYT